MALQSHHHQSPSPFAWLGMGALTFGTVVWWLSTLHFDNSLVDALPATASLFRDVAAALVVILWMPVLVVALVVGAAVCFTIAGRQALDRRAPAVPLAARSR
jgi:hypothetical protein